MKKCLAMVSDRNICVEMLPKEMEQLREEFVRFKASELEAKCPAEELCRVEIPFDSVEISLFERNVVLKTCLPSLLLMGTMSDRRVCFYPEKLWPTALCVLLKCTSSTFVAR
jgi:hypothetical protein